MQHKDDEDQHVHHGASLRAAAAYDLLPGGMSLVDERWEVCVCVGGGMFHTHSHTLTQGLDPNPDIRALFLTFNDLFFFGKLAGIEVKWSPRMTLCAGICSFDSQLCSVRLSQVERESE
jgi:hypothetical protein